MDSSKDNHNICLNLTSDEALVLLDWLGRFNENGHTHFSFQDQSEERVLFDLESVLEKSITEIFDGNYKGKLSKARENVRDRG